MEKEIKMAKKKKASKKAEPIIVAPAPSPKPKKVSVLDQCPPTRSISEWCQYISSNGNNFTAEEVTEARQHIQKTVQ